MRESSDDAIKAGHTHRAGERELPRPPGGKALIRLLYLLESAGYSNVADASLKAALSEDKREEFRVQAVQFTAAPNGQPAAERLLTGPGQTPAKGKVAESENVAQLSIDAAERLAPP